MPRFDVTAQEPNTIHGALITSEPDDQRANALNPFFKALQGQWPVPDVVEYDPVPSFGLQASKNVPQGNWNAFRRFVSYVVVDVDKKK
jgi:hypothetical protein